jgi:hypothetical protein
MNNFPDQAQHEHSELFAALRAQAAFEGDTQYAGLIKNETHPRAVSDGKQFAAGRRFAAELATNHGIEGIKSLYRCLRSGGIPFDDDDVTMDKQIGRQLIGKSREFISGAMMFCECLNIDLR